MSKRTILVLFVVWLALIWGSFLFYQHQGILEENHFREYLSSWGVVLLVLVVAAAAGLRLLGPPHRGKDLLPAGALGLALIGVGALGLGLVGLVRSYSMWILLALLAAVSYKQLRWLLGGLRRCRIGSPGWISTTLGLLMGFAVLVCLVNCLAPLTANDALVYHLNVPKIYTAEGRIINLPFNVYANMPHYGEVLYTFFYSVSGETAAKLFYLAVLLATAGAIYSLATRFVRRELAVAGAGIFLIQPLLLDYRVICNVDVLLAYFYITAACLAFGGAENGGSPRRFVALGLLAGFMLGTKYTALVPCLTLLLIPLLACERRPATAKLALAAAVALLVFVPWPVKNQIYVSNPLYPLFEGLFDGRNWDQIQGQQLLAWQGSMGMGRSLKDYLLLAFNVSTRAKPGLNYALFDGTISPLLLILLPFALFRPKRSTSVLLAMVLAGLVFWSLSAQQLRFLIPTLALGSVLASVGLANISKLVGRRAFGVILIMVMLVAFSTLLVPYEYGRPFLSSSLGDRLPVAIGVQTRSDFLRRNVQSYAMFEHIDNTLPAHEGVFMVWENRGYYLDRPYFADSFFEASTFMRMVAAAGDAQGLRRTIDSMGYRYVLVNGFLGDFFSRAYPPRMIALFEDFKSRHLQAVHSANGLTLYQMKAP